MVSTTPNIFWQRIHLSSQTRRTLLISTVLFRLSDDAAGPAGHPTRFSVEYEPWSKVSVHSRVGMLKKPALGRDQHTTRMETKYDSSTETSLIVSETFEPTQHKSPANTQFSWVVTPYLEYEWIGRKVVCSGPNPCGTRQTQLATDLRGRETCKDSQMSQTVDLSHPADQHFLSDCIADSFHADKAKFLFTLW